MPGNIFAEGTGGARETVATLDETIDTRAMSQICLYFHTSPRLTYFEQTLRVVSWAGVYRIFNNV
jgi:hypothetical protein